MKEFLVSKFYCSKCGEILTIERTTAETRSPYIAGEPTGADMVEIGIKVRPCFKCMQMLIELTKEIKEK